MDDIELDIEIPQHVLDFDEVLMHNNSGIEPISNWHIKDIEAAIFNLQLEMASRFEPDGG